MGWYGSDARFILRHSRNKEFYRSGFKQAQVEIAHRPAVIAAPPGCSFGELFLGLPSPDIQRVSNVSVSDHPTATPTPCCPVHLVRHLKPRGPERQARQDKEMFGPSTGMVMPR